MRSWLQVRPRASAPAGRLFCFPWAGSGAGVYHEWGERLPAHLQLMALQLPGRQQRVGEPPFRRMEPLVAALGDVLAPHLDRPYVLFGHSMGALVAFEVARRLRQMDAPAPAALVISAARAPHLPRTKRWSELPDRELLAELGRSNPQLAEVGRDAELAALTMPALRADLALCESYQYRPEPPLEAPLTALGGTADGEVGLDELLAWRRHGGRFAYQVFPGDHFYIHSHGCDILPHLTRALPED
jgi:surfactin synthase thioesterase subunit